MLRFVICTIFALLLITQNCEARDNDDDAIDERLKQTVQFCLKESNLRLADFGLSICFDQFKPEHLITAYRLPKNKRSCFMACLFKQYEVIDRNGRIVEENLPVHPNPNKIFPISLQASIAECKAKKTPYEVGECLYNIYFT